MRLNFWIRNIKDNAHNSNFTGVAIERDVLPLLQELQDRRSSDLRPCDKFLNKKAWEQFDHIVSELVEVDEEFMSFNEERIAEEVVDVQMSCETLLAIIGLDEQQRRDMRRKVIAKNEARQYYEVGE